MQVEQPFVVRLSHDPAMWRAMCLVFCDQKVFDPWQYSLLCCSTDNMHGQ